MRMDWREIVRICALTAVLALLLPGALPARAEDGNITVRTDADIAASLGLLLGDGNGVTEAYLRKPATRLQAAIIHLRLMGLLDEASSWKGAESFADAGKAGSANRPILAYLRSHPELGWQGTGGGRFDPLAPVSSQQLYKVLLESLGYRTGTDFAYADTEKFAAAHGLAEIAGTHSLLNGHIATALVETLSASARDGRKFQDVLQDRGVIAEDAALPESDRIRIRRHAGLGPLLTDGAGRTLYYFTKDAEDLNACQGNCLANWPVYFSESLLVPYGLAPADFGALTREDGTMQLTYKGWPLYYFAGDHQPGDVNGQNVNGVWFVINPDTFRPRNGGPEEPAKVYRVDIRDFSFGSEPLTVEAGAQIVFTNHDDVKHNAVAVDGSFATPLLAKGESYTITLTEPGTYDYYCEPHKSFMTGQIIVK